MSSVAESDSLLANFKWIHSVTVRPRALAATANYLYFLHKSPLELARVPITSPSVGNIQPVDLSAVSSTRSTAALTQAEELRRERLRFHFAGIASFKAFDTVESDVDTLFIQMTTAELYLVRLTNTVPASAVPLETPRSLWEEIADSHILPCGGAKMDVTHCPDNPFLISFVTNSNLFVAEFSPTERRGDVVALTTVGAEGKSCAVADYIMQEEFHQYTAHWWAPQQTPSNTTLEKQYRIAYTVTDVTMLDTVSIFGRNDAVEKMPFPKVGDPNAVSSIVVSDLVTSAGNIQCRGRHRMLHHAEIRRAFPSVEYLTRVTWRDHNTLYLVALSRTQEEAYHYEVDINSFPECPEGEANFFDASAVAVPDGIPLRVVLHHAIPWAWVETTDDIFPASDGSTVVGLHSLAEKTEGFYQLHLIPAGGNSAQPLPACPSNANIAFHSVINAKENGMYFKILARDSMVHSVFHFDPKTGKGTQLSAETHHVSNFCVLQGGGVAYVASTETEPPFLAFRSVLDAPLQTISVPLHPNFETDAINTVVAPEIRTVVNDAGYPLPMALFMPHKSHTMPAAGYPLMVYVYGGPHVQLVWKSFELRCNAVFQALLSKGIGVAILDNQMCNSLGLRAHAVCKRAMGSFEIKDYRKLVEFITTEKWMRDGNKTVTFDPKRVGIYGWSYGGYASLLAMCQASDVFKLGFAGAPVGDWRFYDTGYTERYMGLLEKDAATYESSSITAMAAGFPDEYNRVFIGHGMADENVHFRHTSSILQALVDHNKPYNLQVYPGERHGLRQNPKSRKHYDIGMIAQVAMYL